MGNITIKSVWSATVEEIIRDLTHPEDLDLDLVISAEEDGTIRVNRRDFSNSYTGDTLKGALIELGLSYYRERDPRKHIEWEELDILDGEHLVLDYRDADLPVQE